MSVPITPMRAVTFSDYGKPASQKLQLSTVNTPIVSRPNDVVIKVVASALNPVDFKMIHGDLKTLIDLELPSKIGFDVSGLVSAIGSEVKRFKVGDEVYSEEYVAHKPKSVSFDEAAGVPLAGLTALQAIRNIGKFQPGQRILILGGSGGVGTLAIQLASKVLQASEVIVTAGAHAFDLVKSLGATQMIDYKTENYTEKVTDVDLVFDTIGDSNNAFKVVKSGGLVVNIMGTLTTEGLRHGGFEIGIAMSAIITAASAPTLANAALHSAHYKFCWMHPNGAELAEFAEWIDSGLIKPITDSVFPFDQYEQAFDKIAEGHAKGKIIVHVQQP